MKEVTIYAVLKRTRSPHAHVGNILVSLHGNAKQADEAADLGERTSPTHTYIVNVYLVEVPNA